MRRSKEGTWLPRCAVRGSAASALPTLRNVLIVALAAASAIGLVAPPAAGQDGSDPAAEPDQTSDAPPDPPDPDTVERLEMLLVDERGQALDGGGSATPFGIVLEGEDECPGDSVHDQFRIDSYMVPVAVDPTQLMFTALGPTPPSFRDYAGFQMPVYKLDDDPYAAQLTSQPAEAGGPGPIPELPRFGWGVYVPTTGIEDYAGGLPSGEYRIGVACTYATRVTNLWETTIEITPDATDEPVGIAWTVTGSQPSGLASSSSGSGSDTNWLVYGLIAFAAVMAAVALVLYRSSRRSSGGAVSHEGSPA